MPSSLASGPKYRSLKGGGKWHIVPDFFVSIPLAAANLTGADSGIFVFAVPENTRGAVFLGLTEIHGTAGTNSFVVKKVDADTNGAAGTAVNGTTHVALTAAVPLTGAANTLQEIEPITAEGENLLAPGDKLAIVSASGTAGLAGGNVVLRLAWL